MLRILCVHYYNKKLDINNKYDVKQKHSTTYTLTKRNVCTKDGKSQCLPKTKIHFIRYKHFAIEQQHSISLGWRNNE